MIEVLEEHCQIEKDVEQKWKNAWVEKVQRIRSSF
jgi:hypothetical protein